MRILTMLLLVLSAPAWADVVNISAPISKVTVYSQGAVITRQATIDGSEGQVTLRVEGLDPGLSLADLGVSLEGATLVSRTWNTGTDAPYRVPRTPEWELVKAAVETAEDALHAHRDQIASFEAQIRAAEDQIAFLNKIALSGETPPPADALSAIGQRIASDGAAARTAILNARAEIRSLERLTPDLEFNLAQARAKLATLERGRAASGVLELEVSQAEANEIALAIRYTQPDATWRPFYKVTLTEDDRLSVERSVGIQQSGTENWLDVSLILSTLNVLEALEPGQLWEQPLRLIDPEEAATRALKRTLEDQTDMLSPAPMVAEMATSTAAPDFSGVGISYILPQTVSIPADQSVVMLSLDTLEFDAEVKARALPRLRDVAYRQVSLENTSEEILLPGQAQLFVGEQVIGTSSIALLPPRATSELFFGPIEGLRLKRVVVDRNEADRGLITRSNEKREEIRLEVENLTNRDWDVELRESVPYSEQEDLVIDWSANPQPDEVGIDDRRGILGWSLNVAQGESAQVELETAIEWPEGQTLP